jgi:hypothetical protein
MVRHLEEVHHRGKASDAAQVRLTCRLQVAEVEKRHTVGLAPRDQ